MKLNAATQKNLFLLICLCFIVALLVAVGVSQQDQERHKTFYAEYEEANELFKSRSFEEAYAIYERLLPVYPDAYVLELKMTVCAMNLDRMEEAVGHARRTLELYPLLARDEDFISALTYSLEQLGDAEGSQRIWDYYFSHMA
ncbi:MAG: hypothetical protein LBU58_04835 [Clostridiales bacterium]|jgi:tetratricopeptide (TPR) repeat protein|nr:hypothetical protein [Clostridiales bacterium]